MHQNWGLDASATQLVSVAYWVLVSQHDDVFYELEIWSDGGVAAFVQSAGLM